MYGMEHEVNVETAYGPCTAKGFRVMHVPLDPLCLGVFEVYFLEDVSLTIYSMAVLCPSTLLASALSTPCSHRRAVLISRGWATLDLVTEQRSCTMALQTARGGKRLRRGLSVFAYKDTHLEQASHQADVDTKKLSSSSGALSKAYVASHAATCKTKKHFYASALPSLLFG